MVGFHYLLNNINYSIYECWKLSRKYDCHYMLRPVAITERLTHALSDISPTPGPEFIHASYLSTLAFNRPLSRYVKLRVAHASRIPGTVSPPPRVNDTDMHRGTCVTQMLWCMPGTQTSSFLWNRWRGKRYRHSCTCTTRNFMYLVRGPCTQWHQPCSWTIIYACQLPEYSGL